MSFWISFRKSLQLSVKKPALFLISLLLVLAPLQAGKIPCKFTTEARIVAVADIHGDCDNFKKILKGTGLIDDEENWIGGEAHLVQLGDILDRGDNAKEALDLLMKLEKQAQEVGGMVHMLIGNHEEANITGLVFDQPGYISYLQLKSFLPKKYFERKDQEFRKELESINVADGELDAKVEWLWEKEIGKALGKINNETRFEYTKNFYENYGKWLLTKNIAIKINENIFVHGGIPDNDEFLSEDLETLNEQARREFRIVAEWATDPFRSNFNMEPIFLLQPESPQWYRGWARDPEDGNSSNLKRVLANYKAERMIIGHTVRDVEYIETRQLARFDDRVWAIDVGISDYYNDLLFALIIEKRGQESIFEPWWGDDEKK